MKNRIVLTPKHFAVAAMSLACILLTACSFDNTKIADNGGGSDQPNRLVVGKIMGGDGIAQVSARVRLYSGKYQTGYDLGLEPAQVVLDTEVRTDIKGAFALSPYLGVHFLEACSADSSAIFIEESSPLTKDSANLGAFNLAEAASLTGTVLSKHPIASMLLAGTHFQTIPAASGKFIFPLLPPGKFRLVARMGADFLGQLVPVTVVNLEAGQTLDLDTIIAEPNQILMFNFDTVENFNRLRGLTFPFDQSETNLLGGWWPRPQQLVTTGAFRKKSLHSNLKSLEYMSFSLGLGYYDLSKMTALSFWGKGSGKIFVQFHSKLIAKGDPTFMAGITLTSTWTEFRILPSDISSEGAPAKNYFWDLGKNKIGKINFATDSTGAEIWLDEIRIEGMTHRDLGNPESAGDDALPNK